MKVLSLFDGISCGMVALERAGIKVEEYHAYEIEPNAIEISKKNYPQIEHCGDVMSADFTQYRGIDLLIGGSPCTNWSCNKNHNAKAKKETKVNEGIGWTLFMQFVRAVKEAKPKYFLYENNHRIPGEIQSEITRILGVEPIMIDSALVSAQRRKRLYWTNIQNIDQPEDRGIFIKDVFIPDEKLIRTDKRILSSAIVTENYVKYDLMNKGHYSEPYRLYYLDGKMKTLPRCRTETKCNVLLNREDLSTYKIVSPVEAERYQTLPDNYTEGIPKTRRFEVIGNGWTVDVIAHIFSYLKTAEEIEDKYMEVLEKHGWAVIGYTDDGRVELEKYSPVGEDFSICIGVENLPAEVREYAASFDIDEHIEMWIEARKNGVSGVPSTRELVKDAEDIDKMLQEIAVALSRAEEASECNT